MNLPIKKLNPRAVLPQYQTPGSSGADLYALLDNEFHLMPHQTAAIPTGLAVAVPLGFEMQIRARSGLAAKGIIVPNGPGTIDSDYRGELKILLHNLSDQVFVIEPEMRIAQAVVTPVQQCRFVESDTLPATDRNDGGFGSTGIK